MKKFWLFGKVLFFLCAAGVLLSGSVYDPPADRPLAFVQKFKPSVGVEKSGSLQSVKKRGRPLYNNDTLRTNEHGFALVQFMDKSLVKVKPESQLIVQGEIEGKQNTNTRIGIETGEIFLNVASQSSENFEVATSTTVASVKGTQFGASSDNYFWVQEGEVQLLADGSGETTTLTDQTYGQVQQDGSIETGELSEEEVETKRKDFDEMDEDLTPVIYELRFIDNDGQEQIIRLRVFENDN